MFTKQFLREIKPAFDAQIPRLGERGKQVLEMMDHCAEEEKQALICLYASMPVSDAADYPPELFYEFAKHRANLWENGSFAGKIPEQIFCGLRFALSGE